MTSLVEKFFLSDTRRLRETTKSNFNDKCETCFIYCIDFHTITLQLLQDFFSSIHRDSGTLCIYLRNSIDIFAYQRRPLIQSTEGRIYDRLSNFNFNSKSPSVLVQTYVKVFRLILFQFFEKSFFF